MPTLIPAGFALGVLRWTVAGDLEEQISTLGLRPGVSDTAQSLAEALHTSATQGGSIAAPTAMNIPWVFVGTRVHWAVETGIDTYVHNAPVAGTGSGSTACPSNCSALVTKVTTRGGRRGRGRMFLPAAIISDTFVDTNGVIDSGTFPTIQNRVIAFRGQLVINNLDPVLFHNDGSAPDDITDLRLETQIATQRRRMRR